MADLLVSVATFNELCKYFNFKLDADTIRLPGITLRKDKFNMSDKIKVTLTRQAAADMLQRHTLEGHSNIDNMINFYVEAGMLEVVEGKITDNPTILALCAIMTEIEVRQGPDYGKLYVAYPSHYGACCLIDGLKMKGYKIVKDMD